MSPQTSFFTSLFWLITTTLTPLALSHIPTPSELHLLKRNLNKPVINSNFYDTLLDPSLLKLLTKTTYSLSPWTSESNSALIPEGCASLTEAQSYNNAQLSRSDVDVFNVTYPDCTEPWIFCIHKQANTTQDQMAEIFGRLPVRMRSYLRHMVAVPGVASAASMEQNTVLIGDAAQRLTVYGHEIGHSLDDHAFGVDSGFSQSQTWLSAYNQDSAVCQSYAQTNQQENLAQMINVALFDQVNSANGGIGSICPIWQQFGHMLAAIRDNIGQTLTPGGSCANRPSPDALLKKSGGDGGGDDQTSTQSDGDVIFTHIPDGSTSTAGGNGAGVTTTATTSGGVQSTGRATSKASVESFAVPSSTGGSQPSSTAAKGDASALRQGGGMASSLAVLVSLLFGL